MATSFIDIWHGFGKMTAAVSHDGENGNTAGSFIELDFGESQRPLLEIGYADDDSGCAQKISLSIHGSCERSGLARLLIAAGEELLKPAAELGKKIAIGYEPADEDESARSRKGQLGEWALNGWLRSVGVSYLYVNQSPDTFANLFAANLKRPDFLVLLESIGLIAVDAKNYTLYKDEYSLSMETELRRVLTFERLFRIPVWYAYLEAGSAQADGSSGVWHWISALKVLEVGQVRKNSRTGEEFLVIKLHHFERIETGADLGKLYTHRLPSLKKIGKDF